MAIFNFQTDFKNILILPNIIEMELGKVQFSSRFPTFCFEQKEMKETFELKIIVATTKEVENNEQLNEKQKNAFKKDGQAISYKQNYRNVYLSARKCLTFTIQQPCSIFFTQQTQKQQDFIGVACDLLSSAYKFSRKTDKQSQVTILLVNKRQQMIHIIDLVNAKNRSRELANGRGDVEGIPEYFVHQVLRIKQEYGCKAIIIKGEQLLKEGFRLLHAVGRASIHEPVFANLSYEGDKNSDKFIAFIGKGVCFDSGGLNIKHSEAMKPMFLDKQGACSVLTAFEDIVRQKLPINLTCSIGLVENYIGPNSYRPSDIIKSRKGYTVKVDDTDAQGRLVLADAMNWTQERFQTNILIQLSTLTYSNVMALGQKYAGMFSNDTELTDELFTLGKIIHQHVWRMPVDIEHHEALQIPQADFLSDNSGQWMPGGSIGAAFLQNFVEQGTKWAHLDIGGVGFTKEFGTGWGAMLLIEYAKQKSNKIANKQ